jgi:hypothetical protein
VRIQRIFLKRLLILHGIPSPRDKLRMRKIKNMLDIFVELIILNKLKIFILGFLIYLKVPIFMKVQAFIGC